MAASSEHSLESGAMVTGRSKDVAETTSPVASASLSCKNWSNLVSYIVNFAITYASLTGVFGETNTALSKKYQTLVTPAGWAFSIWGPIFIAEGIFAVAQMFPRFRSCQVVTAITPWWLAACAFQAAWTIAFAQEIIPLSLVCMFGILTCLCSLALSTDGLNMTITEYFVLRAPFSLHLGWIIAASVLNTNVQADAAQADPEFLLGFAILSYAAIAVAVTIFAVVVKSPDAVVCFVAAWALAGIRAELGNPDNLNNPNRLNPYLWNHVILGGLRNAALGVILFSIGFGVLAGVRIVLLRREAHNARASC